MYTFDQLGSLIKENNNIQQFLYLINILTRDLTIFFLYTIPLDFILVQQRLNCLNNVSLFQYLNYNLKRNSTVKT